MEQTLFMFLRDGERMREQLDAIQKTVIETNTSVSLLHQEQKQTKEQAEKTAAKVESIESQQLEHTHSIEKLGSFSGSQKKQLDQHSSDIKTLQDNQKSKQPFWDVLGKIYDRFIFAGVGAFALWAVSKFTG